MDNITASETSWDLNKYPCLSFLEYVTFPQTDMFVLQSSDC